MPRSCRRSAALTARTLATRNRPTASAPTPHKRKPSAQTSEHLFDPQTLLLWCGHAGCACQLLFNATLNLRVIYSRFQCDIDAANPIRPTEKGRGVAARDDENVARRRRIRLGGMYYADSTQIVDLTRNQDLDRLAVRGQLLV